MNSNYRKNKERAVFRNNQPTKTDQSQGHETDINVIVKRYGIGGGAPGAPGQPMYGDFTEIPDNLRDMLELTRKLEDHRARLPEQLRAMPPEELLALQPADLKRILTPPATTPASEEVKP